MDQTERVWLIWSTEHAAWWRPNWAGYTKIREEAGLYGYGEACAITKTANIGLNDVPNESMIHAEPKELAAKSVVA